MEEEKNVDLVELIPLEDDELTIEEICLNQDEKIKKLQESNLQTKRILQDLNEQTANAIQNQSNVYELRDVLLSASNVLELLRNNMKQAEYMSKELQEDTQVTKEMLEKLIKNNSEMF